MFLPLKHLVRSQRLVWGGVTFLHKLFFPAFIGKNGYQRNIFLLSYWNTLVSSLREPRNMTVDLGATKASGYHTWLIPSMCLYLKVNKQSEGGGRGERHGSSANYLWLWVSRGWSLHQARTWKNVSGSVARWVASPCWSFPPEPLPTRMESELRKIDYRQVLHSFPPVAGLPPKEICISHISPTTVVSILA